MTTNIDRIKDKLAKLLRLGENSAATDGEIDNALTMAASLMAKHQLTREDIDMNEADPIARVTVGRHFAFTKGGNLTSWERLIHHFVCEFIGSIACYNAGKMTARRNGIAVALDADGEPRRANALCFYGSDDDARCAVSLFEELRDAIAAMAIIRWGSWAKADGGAYAYGFAQGLRDANKKAKRELMNTDEQTTALMITSGETQLAIVSKGKAWLKTTHNITLQTRSGRRTSFGSRNANNAMSEGRRDGSNYNVNRPGLRPCLA
jgi:hypothetical protein